MPRLKGSADLLEDRRRRALALLDDGLSLNEVGRQIGCNPSSVMRWRDARRRGGVDALQVRFSPGRPLKLAAGKRKRLVRLLLKGPMAQGYRTNLWTTPRIAEMVEREFGVRYHPDHIGRLMSIPGCASSGRYGPDDSALQTHVRPSRQCAASSKDWFGSPVPSVP